MEVYRPEPVCHAKELGCYLQGQGHNKGLCNLNMTVLTISSELMGVLRVSVCLVGCLFLQPNLVCWETIISQNIH